MGKKHIKPVIEQALYSVGMPTNISGYVMSVEMIRLVLKDPTYLFQVTKRLYPDIAERFNTTDSRAERAIRHAVERTFGRMNYKMLVDVFGVSLDADKGKQTNSEFAATMARKISWAIEGRGETLSDYDMEDPE